MARIDIDEVKSSRFGSLGGVNVHLSECFDVRLVHGPCLDRVDQIYRTR